jgi:hypothetical protein
MGMSNLYFISGGRLHASAFSRRLLGKMDRVHVQLAGGDAIFKNQRRSCTRWGLVPRILYYQVNFYTSKEVSDKNVRLGMTYERCGVV